MEKNSSIGKTKGKLSVPRDRTGAEIKGQPELWLKIWDYINAENERIKNFLAPLLDKKHLQVVLTGAGSSAFIGETVQHTFKFNSNVTTKAVSTTSLVTHFENYLNLNAPTLLISFARSGNSPESLAVIDRAEKYCSDIHHLAITCNVNGKLAKKINSFANSLTLALPPESEDQGLAMTGSFTGMLLAALLIASFYKKPDAQKNSLERVSETAFHLIEENKGNLKEIAKLDFDRIIFLGSGPLLGIARESHLKVQELTDGRIIGKYDSYLGFRHGPKAVINEKSLIVYLFSQDKEVFKYEKDLADQIANDGFYLQTVGIFASQEQSDQVSCDSNIVMKPFVDNDHQQLSPLLYVLPAQIIGYYKCKELGLNPDAPSRNNVISRVVEGVTIYPT